MKKVFGVLLVACMIFSLTSCSGKKSNGGNNGKPADVTVAIVTSASLPDLPNVQTAINQILEKKVNCDVTIKVYSWTDYSQKLNLEMAAQDKLDLAMLQTADYITAMSSGKLLDITKSLNKYGQGIKTAIGSDFLPVGQNGGKQYAIPSLNGWAKSAALLIRTDILQGAGVQDQVSSVKKLSDLTGMFEKIHAKYPDTPILGTESTDGMLDRISTYDPLDDTLGVLLNQGKTLNVTDWYASDEYASYVKLMRQWRQAGYIAPDTEIATDTGTTLIKSKAIFGYIGAGDEGSAPAQSANSGYPITAIRVTDPLLSTSAVGSFRWVVPVNCKDTDSAVKVLNQMYTNSDVTNLFDWGIKGTHYVVEPDGTAGFPTGVTSDNSKYYPGISWYLGSEFAALRWQGAPKDITKDCIADNKNDTRSKALGFTWDPTSMSSQITALKNVTSQYRPALESGAVDPDQVLPKFIQALKSAGIDTVITEKQRQLNAWAKANKVS